MKQKDIALIIVAIVISTVASFVVSKTLITTPKNRKAQVEIVEKISSDFPSPSNKYFNKDSIDPTKLIQIGDNPNPAPFH